MRTVLLTLVTGLALAGCSGGTAEEPDAPPAPGRSTTRAAEPVPAQPKPTAPRADGPLQLDDSRGKACASLRYGYEYTAWEHVLEPTETVTLLDWRLVEATDVTVGRGFVAERPTRVPATGFTSGFPPPPEDVRSRHVDWDGRRPAAGATLEAGTSSNFWVRVQVDRDVRRAGYRGLELRYTADGQEYTALSDIRTRFRWRCF